MFRAGRVRQASALPGSIVPVIITGLDENRLTAKLIEASRRMRTFGEAPPEETGLFARLKKGLAKSSAGLTGSLTGLFTKKKLDAETVAGLEEALIRADMGVTEAQPSGRRRGQEPL